MTVAWTDSTISIIYKQPRKGMLDAGAKPGSLLLDGTISGDEISGTARIFAGRCGTFTYPVKGSFSQGNRNINLKGQAPVIDKNSCQQIKTIPDSLDFNYLDATELKSQLPVIVSKTSECAAVTMSMAMINDIEGNKEVAQSLSKYGAVWGETAVDIGQSYGVSKQAVFDENKKFFNQFKADWNAFLKSSDSKMKACTTFLKSDPQLLQTFQKHANK